VPALVLTLALALASLVLESGLVILCAVGVLVIIVLIAELTDRAKPGVAT
jgi:hypothetical protein